MSTDLGTDVEGQSYDPAGEVVDLCRELIRIDTTNYGDDDGPGERKAAEYVAGLLDEVGIESRLYEAEPGRTSVVARWGGTEGDALLLHGHLDVVPAAAEDWKVDPFSGEIQDGYVWGRGAVDMKDFDAMLLSIVRARTRAGAVPERPIVLCFTADEEAGGHKGAAGHRRGPSRGARGLHRGRGRGRRVQRHRPGPPDLPHRGRREGHGLDAADRARAGRARLDDQRRQRGHPADGRGRADRCPRVAGAADAGDEDPARVGRRSWPAPRPRPRTPRRWSTSSARPPGCSAPSSATPPTRPCSAPATRST